VSEYRIVVPIDAQTGPGSQKVKQDLRGIATEAKNTKAAINSAFDQAAFDRTVGGLTARLDGLDKTLGSVAAQSATVGKSQDALATSLDRLNGSVDKVGKGMANVGKGAGDAAKGQTALEASTRRVLAAVDTEAAELARLNNLLGDAKRALDAGTISQEQFARVQKLATDGVRTNTQSVGQQRAGYQQLGFQVQDITSTLAMGISPLTVLAQQGGQTASALTLALGDKGALGKAAGFIAGPFGSIVLAAGVVLGGLAVRFFNTGSAIDEAVKKLREDAKETEANRVAKDRFKLTQEGVTAAIRDGTDATRKSVEATRSSAEQANIEAKINLQRIVSIRNVTKALLEQEAARTEFNGATNTGSGNAGLAAQGGLQRSNDLQERIKKQDAAIREAETRVQQTRIDLAVEVGAQQATAVGRVTREYDKQISALELAARKQVNAGKAVDASLTAQIARLQQRKSAAIEATQAAERLDKASGGDTTRFISPVSGGRVSSGFGPRAAPTAGASTFHKGIDIAAPLGTPVKAAAGGVVIYAGKLGGLGNAIIVDHGGGTITEYGHLSSVLTNKGAKVGQGQQIGAVGSTGVSTGNHLDYRVKVGGRYVDPRGGRYRTDETQADVRAATAQEQAEARRKTAEEAAARKREQESDFVQGVVDEAASRGFDGQTETLQAKIDRTLADFNRRFDRAATEGERGKISAALTDADSRETARHFDQAYVEPLNRLRALQGVVGQDRAVLNAQLDESTRLGRDLTPVQAQQIADSIKIGDALQRQSDILGAVRQPIEDYRAQLAALNALLAQGAISQTTFSARVGELGQSARDFKGGLPGNASLGGTFSDNAQREDANAERDADLEKLRANLEAGTILESECYGIREAIARKHSDRMRQIDDARRDAAIGSAASIADSLLSIATDSVGKQSAVYKGLFLISKGFAIAESVIKIQQGIANALSLPFPANIGAAAVVAANAASIVSTIQSAKLNFADGGKIRGPGGPRDDSVPINASNGEFVVNAAAVARPGNEALLQAMNSGNLTAGTRRASNDNAAAAVVGGGAGDSWSLSFGDINVQTTGDAASAQDQAREIKAQFVTIVRAEIANAKRSGGALTKTAPSVMSG
jgi:murein DD-endopeptidase MepM/ murein hydrolase activator NlpD